LGGSGLVRTDDFQKFCESGLNRIQFLRIRIGLGLKNFPVRSSLSGGRRSAKTGSEKLDGMRGTFSAFTPFFCQNFSTENAQIWILIKNFKRKGTFLLFSFDSLLSRGSRNVFTGFLARSTQELWLIKGFRCQPE